jgi:HEPN domain-containing protein
MGRRYVEEARGRLELVRLARDRRLWATVAREAQEAVELLLKGALRLVAVEPARTHDVGDRIRRESGRFPPWFSAEVDHLAAISTEMAGDRGVAFCGDERQELGPQELFDEADAARALDQLEYVAGLVGQLLDRMAGNDAATPSSSDDGAD